MILLEYFVEAHGIEFYVLSLIWDRELKSYPDYEACFMEQHVPKNFKFFTNIVR